MCNVSYIASFNILSLVSRPSNPWTSAKKLQTLCYLLPFSIIVCEILNSFSLQMSATTALQVSLRCATPFSKNLTNVLDY